MSSSEKPTIFIITGAWHRPEHFERLITALQERGFEAVSYRNRTSIDLPGDQLSPDAPETKLTVYDDVRYLRPKLVSLVEMGKTVYVTGHSYGGTVMCELVTEDLTLKSRNAKGLKGGVVGLMFICAFMLRKGETVGDYTTNPSTRTGKPKTSSKQADEVAPSVVYNSELGVLEVPRPDLTFFNDLEPKEQEQFASLLIPFSAVASQALTNVAQTYAPSTYIFCSKDRALEFHTQQKMVSNNKQDGVAIREVSCDASHSPFLSRPKWLAGEIEGAVEWSQKKVLGWVPAGVEFLSTF